MTNKLKEILSEEDVKNFSELIKNLENSPFDYFKVENESVKIVIGKEGMEAINPSTSQPQLTVVPAKASVEVEQTLQEVASTTQEATEEKAPSAEIIEEDGVVQVKAVTAGIFYAQSEPGAPSYVKLGDQVDEDTTVGLVEIMKVYSAIMAGVKGEIVGIHVENGQLIEFGQVLFSVKIS